MSDAVNHYGPVTDSGINLAGTQEKSDVKAEDSDAKDLEKVQEVLGTIVQNLIGQITDTFSVSEEELQGVMDELGMTETDLMDPVQLNELLDGGQRSGGFFCITYR